MKTRVYIAWVTPMSRTRPARSAKTRDSWFGSPNSLTSSAPDTLKRSVIVVFISAFSEYDSRARAATRLPSQRAGSMKTGNSARATSVICHDR